MVLQPLVVLRAGEAQSGVQGLVNEKVSVQKVQHLRHLLLRDGGELYGGGHLGQGQRGRSGGQQVLKGGQVGGVRHGEAEEVRKIDA